jgi:hypothetical protein
MAQNRFKGRGEEQPDHGSEKDPTNAIGRKAAAAPPGLGLQWRKDNPRPAGKYLGPNTTDAIYLDTHRRLRHPDHYVDNMELCGPDACQNDVLVLIWWSVEILRTSNLSVYENVSSHGHVLIDMHMYMHVLYASLGICIPVLPYVHLAFLHRSEVVLHIDDEFAHMNQKGMQACNKAGTSIYRYSGRARRSAR